MLRHKLLTAASAIAVAATFTLTLALPAFADKASSPIGKVIAVKHSGYATRLQQSVKHTIKPGDMLYSGDQIDVKAGNVVQIALDADKNNLIHIPGDTLVQLSKDRAITVDLSRGQVFALLDKLESGTRFKVVTPTAISTVRGTYFGVKLVGAATETSVYRGGVGVNGRMPDGKALGTSTQVNAGDKTVVSHAGTRPQEPQRMSEAEFNQINSIIQSLGELKKPVLYSALDAPGSGDHDAAQDRGDAEINKTEKDKDLDQDANSGGKVVF